MACKQKAKTIKGATWADMACLEAISKWQCSPLHLVQMTLSAFVDINILSYLWCFMCLDTHTMEEMSIGSCSIAWVAYVCQYLLINQPRGAPRKGEKSNKCKKSCKIQYKNAKRVSRGCKKSKKMIMPSGLSARDYIVLCWWPHVCYVGQFKPLGIFCFFCMPWSMFLPFCIVFCSFYCICCIFRIIWDMPWYNIEPRGK